MAFKLNTPPYNLDNTPIYNVDLGDDVLGKANNNGTILINKNLDPSKTKKVVDHEMVHIDQFKRGDLDDDDNNVYWKGKTYSRSQMQEGAKNLPWEKEAYDKA
jgi:ribosome-associated protein YbcJ (S4-like RNA binding protein)